MKSFSQPSSRRRLNDTPHWARYRSLAVPLAIAAAIGVWALVSHYGLIGPTLIASPKEVAVVLRDAIRGGTQPSLFRHLFGTVWRAVLAWLLSVAIGSAVGGLVGRWSTLYRISDPFLEFTRSIPPILAFPLLLVAFDFGEPAYTWTIVYGCAPIVALTVAAGVRSISSVRLDMLAVHEPRRATRALILFMEVLPACVLGARVAFSFSLVIAVVTEMVFTPRNGIALGAVAKDAEIAFQTPVFYALVLMIGVVGYIGNVVIRRIEDAVRGTPRQARTRGSTS